MPDVTPTPKAAVARKRTIAKKRSAAKLDKQACDKYAGLICRQRGRCERCGSTAHALQWAHIIPRRYSKICHEPDNCWALDAGCHMTVDNVAHLKMELVRDTIGMDRYYELWAVAQDTKLKAEYHELRKRLKARAIELGAI